MIEYFSPAVLAAVLRVSSTPAFSIRLALASLLAPREASGSAPATTDGTAVSRATPRQEGASRV
ncbi:hypothetical protein PQR64_04795 [Paraburkholderia phytofirmans]|uniref:hypothetical protein n=1 Tax=Paraburkholderia phytofirmans TaxID=261302 RepID=UPI0038BA1F89